MNDRHRERSAGGHQQTDASSPCCLTWEMEPPWMKEGLSVGFVVGMSGGGEGMLGGRLGLLNVTRTPSGIPGTNWLEEGWRTGGNIEMDKNITTFRH